MHIPFKPICLTLLTLLYIFSLSCDKSTDPPPPPPSFSLNLVVTDGGEQPVPDLRVSCWNLLDLPLLSPPASGVSRSAVDPQAATTIEFSLSSACDYELTIHDLGNNEIDQFNGSAPAGSNAIMWSPAELRSGAYRYTLKACETDPAPFSDIKYAYLHRFDPVADSIGYTNSNGVFRTTKRYLFAHLLIDPEQPYSDETGTSLGTFTILDTVRFVLTDTSSGQSMSFDSVVVDGSNSFNITWDPSGTLDGLEPQLFDSRITCPLSGGPVEATGGSLDVSGNSVDLEMYADDGSAARLRRVNVEGSLGQNYPNPFN